MTNQQHGAQKGRLKAAKKLLNNADCGEIVVNGKTVKVRVGLGGMLTGMGQDKYIRINPFDVSPPAVAEVVNT